MLDKDTSKILIDGSNVHAIELAARVGDQWRGGYFMTGGLNM